MGRFGGPFATVIAHPILGLICYILVTVLLVALFSAGRPTQAWRGIWRVFLTLFTTPFEFLRNALTIIRTGQVDETTYAGTREFVLFRYSRLQYLSIFVCGTLILASGIAASLLALYPQSEIEAGKSLRAEQGQLTAKIAQAQQTVRDADKPGYRQTLQRAEAKAQAAYDAEAEVINAKKQANPFNGPILVQIDNAGSKADLENIRDTAEPYFTGCPDAYSVTGASWIGWTAEQCAQFKAYAVDLIDQDIKLITLGETLTAAREAIDNASNAMATSQAQITSLNSDLAANKASQETNSVFAPRNIGAHLMAALAALISGVVAVLIFVWVGAIAIDVLNWIILLMRSLEAEHEDRLAGRAVRDRVPATSTASAAISLSTPPG
ncbi:MAG: hypothetical protein JWP35_1673 [Caulobacter sp.]|nr:hypothetical protein [Caulobacter sp.]